ncbi:MAG: elongation factor P [Thermoanaerobaculia bacterium]|nr:elongation factor P [Thermoanaerobaculia bacterium]
MQANALRAGMCVLHNNEVCSIMSVTHRTPGNLRAFVQVRMRNLKNGNSFEHRFASTESVERAILDTIPMEYLYSDGDMHHFMSQENYEQVTLSNDALGDTLLYILPNSVIKVDFYEGMPVGVELPNTVILEIVDTEPGMKGATASSSYKPAKMQTGLVVQIPPFVESGAKIEIDTRENKYLRRV